MANYHLKPFSDTSFNIVQNRKTVGEVRKMPVSGLWMGVLHSKHRVLSFREPSNAFRAVVMCNNVSVLNDRIRARGGAPIKFTLETGKESGTGETVAYNAMLNTYVAALNANSTNGTTYRVVNRRR